MNSTEETKGINAVVVLEVIGRPPEHLIETLNELIDKIDNEQGISVIDKKINEPVLMKERNDFYTSFAEIEVESEEILNLAILVFKYMPANVEIISPELIALTNNGWNDILNETIRRLHGYDEIARVMQVEKAVLEKKLKEAFEEKNEKAVEKTKYKTKRKTAKKAAKKSSKKRSKKK